MRSVVVHFEFVRLVEQHVFDAIVDSWGTDDLESGTMAANCQPPFKEVMEMRCTCMETWGVREIWLIREDTRSTLLVSELRRESSVAVETSLLGDGGGTLCGRAGCIIASAGGMSSGSPLSCGGERGRFLRRRFRERETEEGSKKNYGITKFRYRPGYIFLFKPSISHPEELFYASWNSLAIVSEIFLLSTIPSPQSE